MDSFLHSFVFSIIQVFYLLTQNHSGFFTEMCSIHCRPGSDIFFLCLVFVGQFLLFFTWMFYVSFFSNKIFFLSVLFMVKSFYSILFYKIVHAHSPTPINNGLLSTPVLYHSSVILQPLLTTDIGHTTSQLLCLNQPLSFLCTCKPRTSMEGPKTVTFSKSGWHRLKPDKPLHLLGSFQNKSCVRQDVNIYHFMVVTNPSSLPKT